MIRINLLPIELQRRVEIGIRLTWFLIIPVVTILVLVPVYISKVKEAKMLQAEISKVEEEMKKYEGVKTRLAQVEAEIVMLENKIAFIQDKKKQQRFWSGILDRVASILPLDVWLNSLSITSMGNITMTGETYSWNSVANLIRAINESKDFTNAALASTTKTYGKETTPTSVVFQLNCYYKGGEQQIAQ